MFHCVNNEVINVEGNHRISSIIEIIINRTGLDKRNLRREMIW